MGRAGEKLLVEVASKQFGVVTLRQAAACDVSRKVLRRRVETREWTRLHRGVFHLGSVRATLDQLEMAALLAAGDRAVLSHASAARRLSLEVPREPLVHVTIGLSRNIPNLCGVKLWRSRSLNEKDITRRGCFRLTNLARTMIDLASVLDHAWLRAALDSALRQRKSNLTWILQALEEHGQGRDGSERLRRLLEEYQGKDEVPDSVLESLGVELARATGHEPKLHWNVYDGRRRIAEVDLAWPEVRLCVELDGWIHHSSRAAFIKDRARDRALSRLGWMVLRYTWGEVNGDQQSFIDELIAAYQSRAPAFNVLRRWSGRGLQSASSGAAAK